MHMNDFSLKNNYILTTYEMLDTLKKFSVHSNNLLRKMTYLHFNHYNDIHFYKQEVKYIPRVTWAVRMV